MADCNHDRFIDDEELFSAIITAITGVRIGACFEFDPDGNRRITIEELVAVVRDTKARCPRPFLTPTPTPTPTVVCAPEPLEIDEHACAPPSGEYPSILLLPDHGDLTRCCHSQQGIDRVYIDREGIKARLDSICPEQDYDFALVTTSAYPDVVVASNGGGSAVYLPVCSSEDGGLRTDIQDYRHCDQSDTIQGVLSLPDLDRWLHSSEGTRRYVSLHELGHRWSAYAATSIPGVNLGLYHWKDPDPMLGLDYLIIESLMGGVPASTTRFAALDLYLMGFIPPEEVPTYPYVDVSGRRITVTIESIIEATGARVPAYPDAPRDFRLAFVVLVPAGTAPLDCNLALAQDWTEKYPHWWRIATDQRSSVLVGFTTPTATPTPPD